MPSKSAFDRLSLIRAVDQLCWPAALVVARLLAKIPRRRHEMPVILRPGGMGDLICLQMALESLGLRPESFLWIIEKRSLPWAKRMDLPYAVIGPKLLLNVGRHQRVVNSEQHYGVSQIIAISLAGRRRDVTAFSTVRGANIATKICPYNPTHTHEVESFVRLLMVAEDMVGVNPTIVRPREFEDGGDLVVALGGGHAESRSLDLGQWTEILRKWAGQRPFVIVSGPVEREVAEQLVVTFGGQARHEAGDFDRNCEVIGRASRVLTMDGGLTHVASYLGVPTDTLFTSGRELLWMPLSPGSRAFLDGNVPCRPCTMFGHTPSCAMEFRCKKDLVSHVEAAPI